MALNQKQRDAIHQAMDAIDEYSDQLRIAASNADAKNNPKEARVIRLHWDDAQAAESKLMSLIVASDAEEAAAAVKSLNQATAALDRDKQQIDQLVAAFATAGQVLQAITAVVSAVARIAA